MVRRSPGLILLSVAAFAGIVLVVGPAMLGSGVLCSVWKTIGLTCAGMVAFAGLLGGFAWMAIIGTGLVLMVWTLLERSPADTRLA